MTEKYNYKVTEKKRVCTNKLKEMRHKYKHKCLKTVKTRDDKFLN